MRGDDVFVAVSRVSPRAFPRLISSVRMALASTVVEEDPEYEFADNFRASRKSNQNRQMLLHQLSCRLRRQIGVKVGRQGVGWQCSSQSKEVLLGLAPALTRPLLWVRSCLCVAMRCSATNSTLMWRVTAALWVERLVPLSVLCFAFIEVRTCMQAPLRWRYHAL